MSLSLCLPFLLSITLEGCANERNDPLFPDTLRREDTAWEIPLSLGGSLQNPAWSPRGDSLVFTRFRNGYNNDPADLFVLDFADDSARSLVSDGTGNVNLPGTCWNPITNLIAFSSSRDPHDEIYAIVADEDPGGETRITSRIDTVAYEASFSPIGEWIVFESHLLDVEENGIITKYGIDGSSSYSTLTGENDDCRQPNWSPAGERILYQKLVDGQWDIWVMAPDGTDHQQITSGAGDKTDASFSPDGQWIVYGSDEGGRDFANLFIVPLEGGAGTRVTFAEGYDGAPSWSPDGSTIVFESSPGDPDEYGGTSLWMINASNCFSMTSFIP